MLSKSRGQLLRIATILHLLFSVQKQNESLISDEISEVAVLAAVDFIKKVCQQTAFIAGKGIIEEEVQACKTGTHILHIRIPKSATTGIKRFSKFKWTQNSPWNTIYTRISA